MPYNSCHGEMEFQKVDTAFINDAVVGDKSPDTVVGALVLRGSKLENCRRFNKGQDPLTLARRIFQQERTQLGEGSGHLSN